MHGALNVKRYLVVFELNAKRLMRRLGLPQGDDRILRNLKRHAASSDKPLRVVGIDDWSWLKGSRYGTIVALIWSAAKLSTYATPSFSEHRGCLAHKTSGDRDCQS